MLGEKVLDFQIEFSRKHIGLLVVLLLYVANNLILNNYSESMKYSTIIIIVVLLSIDLIISYYKFFHKISIARSLRFIEVFISSLIVNDVGRESLGGLSDCFAIFFYILFVCETIYAMDATENITRVKIAFACQSGFIASIIAAPFVFKSDLLIHLFNYFFMSVVSYMLIFALCSFFGNVQTYYFQYVMAKERLLDKAKDNSDRINEIQHNMMVANEQLGIKKYEIEEAYRKINVANADIKLQNEILNILVSSFDLNILLQKTRKLFNEHFDLCYCGLVFKDLRMRKKFPSGLNDIFNPEERKQFNDFFLSHAFIHEHTAIGCNYIVNDINYEEFPFFKRNKIRSIAIKTIEVSEEHTAIFVLMSNVMNTFKNKEILMDNIFGQIEVLARNLSMYYKVQEMSIKDALSGLYNRRYMNLYFNNNFFEKEPEGSVIVGMLDIDHFKKINDCYGHLFGDVAIKSVANLINFYAVRYDGEAFRYGGEEFVIVFLNKTVDDVVEIMEQLRNKIKTTKVENGEISINVKVSMGVSAYPDTVSDIHILVDRADKAMYYSKQHGRDRLSVDGRYTEE